MAFSIVSDRLPAVNLNNSASLLRASVGSCRTHAAVGVVLTPGFSIELTKIGEDHV